jgi:hypothetical protein
MVNISAQGIVRAVACGCGYTTCLAGFHLRKHSSGAGAVVRGEVRVSFDIRFIIRLFQFIFSVRTVFFFQNKSVNSVFQPAYQSNRTGP